jgi:hypothetical protein
MTEALLPALLPQDLPQRLDGLIEVMRRLRVEYGVTIEYETTLPEGGAGAYWEAINTVVLAKDAPIDDQLDLLAELWRIFSIGPEAARWGKRAAPQLYLVPSPRPTVDNAPS